MYAFISLSLFSIQEMTIPWCLKRAELVFKCVKGEQANTRLNKEKHATHHNA